jgi:CheY-like chemotaxis protein
MLLERESVLVVEDDEIDVRTIRRVFARQGMDDRLQFSRDGQEALELLRSPGLRVVPRIVLLDQNMPRMSGLELLGKLREDPRLKDIPVVMMTTSRNTSEKSRAESLGVLAYFVKEDLMPDYRELFDLLSRLQIPKKN